MGRTPGRLSTGSPCAVDPEGAEPVGPAAAASQPFDDTKSTSEGVQENRAPTRSYRRARGLEDAHLLDRQHVVEKRADPALSTAPCQHLRGCRSTGSRWKARALQRGQHLRHLRVGRKPPVKAQKRLAQTPRPLTRARQRPVEPVLVTFQKSQCRPSRRAATEYCSCLSRQSAATCGQTFGEGLAPRLRRQCARAAATSKSVP
jgi:hypothetical protein